MKTDELQSLKNAFNDYVGIFRTPVREDHRNIAVKQEHTRRVCLNAVQIAKELGLKKDERRLAETIALFHDIGRFPQYHHYKTFDDGISVNHAVLGAK